MPTLMSPRLRRFALTAHMTSSVGLLGSIAAFLALAVAGLTSQDAQTARSAYPAMALIARSVILPLTFASLLTGLVQSLGTPWGVLRHYWILAKLSITGFAGTVLLAKMPLIGHAARMAQETILPLADLRAAGLQLAVHATGGLLVLLVPAVLSVYKPRGLTPYGRRMQEKRAPLRLAAGRQQLARPGGASITITLRRGHVLGFIGIAVAAHMVLLHLNGGGLRHH
jgi:hypothetical protein